MQEQGMVVEIVRRVKRVHYKAGALKKGLESINSELIAIFDADFIVDANFLMETVHFFLNDSIAAVQARWDYTNLNLSLFTLTMSIGFDGHFFIEKPGRIRTSSFISFNGSGGIWRKNIIQQCGGWSARTIAEDLDLAYRAQIKGYGIIYLSNLSSKQEIPPTLRSWIIQQSRWSQGFSQNLRLHAKAVIGNKVGKSKIQSIFQLTIYFIPVLIVLNLITSSFLVYFEEFDPEPFFYNWSIFIWVISIRYGSIHNSSVV